MDNAHVTVGELRTALARLLDAVEEKFGPTLTFSEDYYWNVPFDRATTLDQEPSLDMGSGSDDAASVREFLAGDVAEPVAIWHESEHITGILRAIARLDCAT